MTEEQATKIIKLMEQNNKMVGQLGLIVARISSLLVWLLAITIVLEILRVFL